MALTESAIDKLLEEITFSASRSGGPGGQHVNKVNTRVEIRFAVQESSALNEEQKQLITTKLKNRINNRGELIVISAAGRSQWQNRQEGIRKLLALIGQALKRPRKRKKTKPTKTSRLKRLEDKKRQSWKKSLRRPPE